MNRAFIREMKKMISAIVKGFQNDVHTHIPAQVISYDAEKNTCSIQPCISVFRPDDTDTGAVQLPPIDDIPVQFLGAGSVVLTVPVKEGTYGVYHIAEDDITQWLNEGGLVDPSSIERFNLSDGFFVPGVYPFDSSFSSPVLTDRISMRTKDGSTHVSALESGIVELNGETDFAVAYDDLKIAFDQLKTDFDSLVSLYNAHIHITTATIGASATPGVLSSTASAGTPSSADMSPSKVDTVKLP